MNLNDLTIACLLLSAGVGILGAVVSEIAKDGESAGAVALRRDDEVKQWLAAQPADRRYGNAETEQPAETERPTVRHRMGWRQELLAQFAEPREDGWTDADQAAMVAELHQPGAMPKPLAEVDPEPGEGEATEEPNPISDEPTGLPQVVAGEVLPPARDAQTDYHGGLTTWNREEAAKMRLLLDKQELDHAAFLAQWEAEYRSGASLNRESSNHLREWPALDVAA